MTKHKKRDRAYFLRRLRHDYPAIYAKVISGEISSVRAACIKAELIRPPTPLDALKREWKKASPKERGDFLDLVTGKTPSGAATDDLTDKDGFLTVNVIKQIEETMNTGRKWKGDMSEKLGYKRLDPRLGFAMARRSKPKAEFLKRLRRLLLPRP
jgi:hypothetical protein